MRLVLTILFIVVTLIGCKQEEVFFAPAENTPFVPHDPNTGTDVNPPQAPTVQIVRKPKNHLLGEQTDVVFKVIKGDFELESIGCLIDSLPIPCSFTTDQIELSHLDLGSHKVSIAVADVEGMSGQASAAWLVGQTFHSKIDLIDVKNKEKNADILFVIDNSGSMEKEQKHIAKRISRFFEKIKKLNWRVGIITTDPYERKPATGEHAPYADGALLKFPNGKYFLDSSLPLGQARKLFAETIFRPEAGNGHERGIRNTYRSIERSLNPNGNDKNKRLNQFYRLDAALSVVVISDENETTADGAGRPFADKFKSDGSELLDFIKLAWGSKKLFQFNSVIVRPGDNNCLGFNESFGVAYDELSRDTGGVVENICASDYTGVLRKIADGVVNLQKVYHLGCTPQDIDADGKIDLLIQSKNNRPIPGYSIIDKKIEFDVALQEGQYVFEYHCLGDAPK